MENVALPTMLDGVSWRSVATRATGLRRGPDVSVGDIRSSSLSGGERARAALASALVYEPDLVIADEPTAALDTDTQDAVAKLLYELPRRHERGLPVATHDSVVATQANETHQLADRQPTPPTGLVP